MRKILGIARYTFIEIFRNRIWYVLVLFSAVLIVSSLLLSSLGGEQKDRLFVDLGLAVIEMISFLSTVFAAVTLVLAEMESRTLYLVLTRPVSRTLYIIGRFLGLITIMTCAFLLMTSAHVLLLKFSHVPVDTHYAVSLIFSWEKIVIITAAALLFSLFSTSAASALTFTFFFWIMGHYSTEVLFLARKASQPAVVFLCKTFYYVFPNFDVMNIRDVPADVYSLRWLWAAGGYGITYVAVCLLLTALLFRKKEF